MVTASLTPRRQEFAERTLHATPLPVDLPFYLFFGWGDSRGSGPSPAGDGTISLASQLDPRVQDAATAMNGFGATHVGILSDPKALVVLSRALEATMTAEKH